MEVFKKALLEAAKRKEMAVQAYIDNKKASYPSEDAYYADHFALIGVNETTKLREACDSVAREMGLTERDAGMMFCMLEFCWNDTLDWAHN